LNISETCLPEPFDIKFNTNVQKQKQSWHDNFDIHAKTKRLSKECWRRLTEHLQHLGYECSLPILFALTFLWEANEWKRDVVNGITSGAFLQNDETELLPWVSCNRKSGLVDEIDDRFATRTCQELSSKTCIPSQFPCMNVKDGEKDNHFHQSLAISQIVHEWQITCQNAEPVKLSKLDQQCLDESLPQMSCRQSILLQH
jgi:hypothetical protein